jgi:hypothetical protein
MTADEMRDLAIAEVVSRSDNPAVAGLMAHVLATTEGDPRRALTRPQRFFVALLSRTSGVPASEVEARYDRENAARIVRGADDERWSRLQIMALLAHGDEIAETVEKYREWTQEDYGVSKGSSATPTSARRQCTAFVRPPPWARRRSRRGR